MDDYYNLTLPVWVSKEGSNSDNHPLLQNEVLCLQVSGGEGQKITYLKQLSISGKLGNVV